MSRSLCAHHHTAPSSRCSGLWWGWCRLAPSPSQGVRTLQPPPAAEWPLSPTRSAEQGDWPRSLLPVNSRARRRGEAQTAAARAGLVAGHLVPVGWPSLGMAVPGQGPLLHSLPSLGVSPQHYADRCRSRHCSLRHGSTELDSLRFADRDISLSRSGKTRCQPANTVKLDPPLWNHALSLRRHRR